MSISSEITRINNAVQNAYTEAEAKGATMPSSQVVANLAETIASITAGGSSYKIATGTVFGTGQPAVLNIPHNLGVIPKYAIICGITGTNYTKVGGFGISNAEGNLLGFAIRNTISIVKTVRTDLLYNTNANYISIDETQGYFGAYSTSYKWGAVTYYWLMVG